MLSNLVQLFHQVENKACRFICDHDTPLNTIKEALFQFQKYIGQVEDAAKAQQAEQEKINVAKDAAPVDDAPVASPVAPVADPESSDTKE